MAGVMSTTAPLTLSQADAARVQDVLRRYWGYETLRPLQAEAIACALAGRDSLTVLPTGGGKSLCYQIPPALDASLDVVVSPLISLMKDQVDGLRESGYPAAAMHSAMETAEPRGFPKHSRTAWRPATGGLRDDLIAQRDRDGWDVPRKSARALDFGPQAATIG